MFSYIKGNLEVKSNDFIVIDVNGIGFKIFMSENAINKLEDIGKVVKVYTYMNVREDDISLYGFNTNEELRMFELLIGVSGIGAKSAVAILSNIEPSTFALAVISDDVERLTKLPGIGKKSAQRIILELKDKLKNENVDVKVETEIIKTEVEDNQNKNEAIAALKVLGYRNAEIEKAFEKINVNDLSLYTVITVGIIIPGWLAVLSLNSLTNCIMFTPLAPKAGPTGGAGVAFPASICNLIIFEISFSAILLAPPLKFSYYFIIELFLLVRTQVLLVFLFQTLILKL